MKRLRTGRATTAVLVAIGATLAGAGGGYALAAGSNTITACVSHKGGTLYEASRCKRHDHRISWSQTGPQGSQGVHGVQGVQGVQGIQGQQGEPGPVGPASTAVETSGPVEIGTGGNGNAVADCPSGMVATGGGGVNLSPGVYLVNDAPTSTTVGAAPTSWTAGFHNTSGSSAEVQAVVICAPAG